MLEKIGIGIDIIDINRFLEKPYSENKFFYEKIFHNSEIEYCLNHKNSSQSFAAKFAIKELLPVLSTDATEHALEIILEDYKKFKEEETK